MADCFNCKHRHNMICIPESRDCEKVYLLDDHDMFEFNKERCDFYDCKDTMYDYMTKNKAIRYTSDIADHSFIGSDRIFVFDPCTVIVNGLVYDLFDETVYNYVKIVFNMDSEVRDDGRHIVEIQLKYEHNFNGYVQNIKIVAKAITIRYDKDINSVIINSIGYLGEE